MFVSPVIGVQLSPRIIPLAVIVARQVIDGLTLIIKEPNAVNVALASMLAAPSKITPPIAVNVASAVTDALADWTIAPSY